MKNTLWHKRRVAGSVAHSDGVRLTDAEGDLPLTVRWPRSCDPEGVVVFCHGLGASGADYGGLTGVWAAHGYVVIHPTFPDSITLLAASRPDWGLDPAADHSGWMAVPELRQKMHAILLDPAFWLYRVEIVRRVMDGLESIADQTCGSAHAIPNLACAIAGHSFGAYTSQLLAGAEIDLAESGPTRFHDPRFCAALVLSGQGLDQQGLRAGSWDGMNGPVLTVTGPKDGGAKGQDWRWKCQPYELGPDGDKALMVLQDGDHYLGGFGPEADGIPAQKDALRAVTLAFLDAHLRHDSHAGNWLGLISDKVGTAEVMFRMK